MPFLNQFNTNKFIKRGVLSRINMNSQNRKNPQPRSVNTGSLIPPKPVKRLFGSEGIGHHIPVGEITDRSHNQHIKDVLLEKQHLQDKDHHSKLQLPSGLQAVGRDLSQVADKIQSNPKDQQTQDKQGFLELIRQPQKLDELLLALTNNFDKFENLPEKDRDDILQSLVDNDLLDDFIRVSL